MSRNGSGTFSLLPAYNPVASNTVISTAWANNTLTDIAFGLTTSVCTDGQSTMTGPLNLGNQRVINVAQPTLGSDGARADGLGSQGNWPVYSLGSQNLQMGQIVFGGTNGTGTSLNSAATLGDTNLNWDNVKKELKLTSFLNIAEAIEQGSIITTAATGLQTININSGALYVYTSAATGNFNFNFTGSGSGTSVNTFANLLPVGGSISVNILVLQGSTAFYNNTTNQVDGVAVTTRWQGPVAPSFGSPNGYDAYSFTIIKTAATPSYLVFAARTQFGGLTVLGL
jgi:hypothetical protein